MNEVIREVLNFLFFFTKRFCTHQKAQKAPKNTKKTHKRNQAKVQKTQISEQK